MANDNVVALAAPATVSDPLTDLPRSGARKLIEAAVAAEFDEYLAAFDDQKLADGCQRVVRNGYLPERQVLTGIGTVDVRVPKSRGGADDQSNRIGLCRNCNTGKGRKAWETFLEQARAALPHPKVGG